MIVVKVHRKEFPDISETGYSDAVGRKIRFGQHVITKIYQNDYKLISGIVCRLPTGGTSGFCVKSTVGTLFFGERWNSAAECIVIE